MAAIAFTAYSVATCSWPTAIVGLAIAGWTVYSQFIRKDPLMEAFYKIVGGKENYEQLPEITFDSSEKPLVEFIKGVEWEKLYGPICRAKMKDGRNMVIVKALSRGTNHAIVVKAQTEAVFAFVERLGPNDFHPFISNLSPRNSRLYESVMHAIGASWSGNRFGHTVSRSSSYSEGVSRSSVCQINSKLSAEMANELLAQLGQK